MKERGSPLLTDPALMKWMCDIRRAIHQYPELAFEEQRTARLIEKKLAELGISYRSGVGQTGIVAAVGDKVQDAPCVALRADMDALPVEEKTGLPFASRRPGLMHSCGHDGRVAMLLGAAALLRGEELPGRVVFLFQPAEEKKGGGCQGHDRGGGP